MTENSAAHDLIGRSKRVIIAGGPRVGKTTLAAKACNDHRVRSTDELIHLGWSGASEAASKWFNAGGRWIVEGVATPRAMRKWFEQNARGTPCDLAVWLQEEKETTSLQQKKMAHECSMVWAEILPELMARNVVILELW